MERLSGSDAFYLYMETPNVHFHTLKIGVFEPLPGGESFSYERAREALRERLHLTPTLRRRVVPLPLGFHHPVWIEDPDFDLDRHVHRCDVPAPGGQREMDAVISDITSRPLDPTRPLWDLWYLEGLEGGRFAGVLKLHHTLADGVASANLIAHTMTAKPAGPITPPEVAWSTEPIPSSWRLLRDAVPDHLRQIRRFPGLVRRSARHRRALRAEGRPDPPKAPTTFYTAQVSPRRSLATTSFSLERLKAVKASLGVTLNDVFLVLASGALRRYLADRSELPEQSLVGLVATSTDPESAQPRLSGNRSSSFVVSLATDVVDPNKRLAAIHQAAEDAKQDRVESGELFLEWAEYRPTVLFHAFVKLAARWRLAERLGPPYNAVVSSVKGPSETLYFGDYQMVELYSVGPIADGIGINVTLWSYGDRVGACVLACREHVPDPHLIAEGLHTALEELES